MNLQMQPDVAAKYHGATQKVRVMSELWLHENAVCPSCLRNLKPAAINNPATDFSCIPCSQSFELKSKKGAFGRKVVDGAYSTMFKRLQDNTQPNLFLLSYNSDFRVDQLQLVPRSFLVPSILEKRKPLSDLAKRSGWIGCNIILEGIPEDGKITYVKDKRIIGLSDIQKSWNKCNFLQEIKLPSRSWILAVMEAIRGLNKENFSLSDIYSFKPVFKQRFPANNNIEAKIRQQLQLLRDQGWLTFLGDGNYQVSPLTS